MELNAKIIEVLPVQSGTSSKGDWEKHAFVVSWMDGQYEQKLCLDVMGADKFEKMKNAVVVGNEVLVKYNVTSREYQGRWFTTASCYYCSAIGGSQQPQQSAVPNAKPYVQNNAQDDNAHVDDGGLPF
jgi:Protein of unknown function (DUF3127).